SRRKRCFFGGEGERAWLQISLHRICMRTKAAPAHGAPIDKRQKSNKHSFSIVAEWITHPGLLVRTNSSSCTKKIVSCLGRRTRRDASKVWAASSDKRIPQ